MLSSRSFESVIDDVWPFCEGGRSRNVLHFSSQSSHQAIAAPPTLNNKLQVSLQLYQQMVALTLIHTPIHVLLAQRTESLNILVLNVMSIPTRTPTNPSQTYLWCKLLLLMITQVERLSSLFYNRHFIWVIARNQVSYVPINSVPMALLLMMFLLISLLIFHPPIPCMFPIWTFGFRYRCQGWYHMCQQDCHRWQKLNSVCMLS